MEPKALVEGDGALVVRHDEGANVPEFLILAEG